MGTEEKLTPREAMDRERTRLIEEAVAKEAAAKVAIAKAEAIARDMADYDRLAAKYNFVRDLKLRSGGESVASVAHRYQTDDKSPFKRLRYRTKENYRGLLRRIVADYGDTKLADLKREDVQRIYNDWTTSGSAMAHALVGMLRMLFNYGTTALDDGECSCLSGIIHNMRFKTDKPRKSEYLTADQVTKIINEAHKMGHHSLALAQAFQFYCQLHQRDVIGEWVPNNEPGVSDVIDGNDKWLRGIRWDEIDNLILRHTTSKRLQNVEIDLRKAPIVMREIALVGQKQRKGPIVVSEETNLPYKGHVFRERWRKVADAVGIPKHVKNMDSRPADKPHKSGERAEAVAH
jgi:hypothetical protein